MSGVRFPSFISLNVLVDSGNDNPQIGNLFRGWTARPLPASLEAASFVLMVGQRVATHSGRIDASEHAAPGQREGMKSHRQCQARA